MVISVELELNRLNYLLILLWVSKVERLSFSESNLIYSTGYEGIVKMVIENGAKLNHTINNGKSALILAVEKGKSWPLNLNFDRISFKIVDTVSGLKLLYKLLNYWNFKILLRLRFRCANFLKSGLSSERKWSPTKFYKWIVYLY